jgi:hypothetical protein
MKYSVLFILIITTTFIACNTNSPKVSIPNEDEVESIKPVGDKIANELITSLQDELLNAIKSGGVTEAINVCNIKALPLTEGVAMVNMGNLDLKRTTYKYRNPLNAPNEFEKLALDHFQNKIDNQEDLPEFYIQKINENNETSFYYYKPLITKEVCLNCHGAIENMSNEVYSIVKELYPNDKAIGYKAGEFRGLISIKFPEQ